MLLYQAAMARVGDRSEPVLEFGGEKAPDGHGSLHHGAVRRKLAGQDIEVTVHRRRLERDRRVIQDTDQTALAAHHVGRWCGPSTGQERPAVRAEWLAGGSPLAERLDQRVAAPAAIVQTAPMAHADGLDAEPPAAPEIGQGIGGQTARAVLQHGARLTCTRLAAQQEPAMAEKGIEHRIHAGHRVGNGQRRSCERGNRLPAEQGKPVQRRVRYLGIGIGISRTEGLVGKSTWRRTGGNARPPQPAAEQLIGKSLRPLWPQRRPTQRRQRLQGNEVRCGRRRQRGDGVWLQQIPGG